MESKKELKTKKGLVEALQSGEGLSHFEINYLWNAYFIQVKGGLK